MGAVAQKILEIQKAIRSMKKDGRGFNYEYLTGDKLLGFIRPKMDELGLLLMPEISNITTHEVTYTAFKGQQQYQKTEILYLVEMTMTWVDAETGDTLIQKWAGSGMNDFDKGFGSALTYGERYYLMKLFHIQTDSDDVDAVNVERSRMMEQADQAAAQKPGRARKKFTPDEYARCVMAAAQGLSNARGETMREVFLRTGPTAEELKKFDNDVINAKKLNQNGK